MPTQAEPTSFSLDVQGRYLCNDVNEVRAASQSGGGQPFDAIVVGGGTFGSVIAEHLWFRGNSPGRGPYRVLVIEAGPFVLPEHVQNTGIRGLDVANAATFDELHGSPPKPDPLPPAKEVWGLPWKSQTRFPGLAYCIGGRSLYWGGWSPRLLDAEVTTWPPNVVADLNATYFDESSRQIGVDDTNDFIFGELQNALRAALYAGIGAINEAIPPAGLPLPTGITGAEPPDELARRLGLPAAGALRPVDLRNLLKLEAPLAVQARPPYGGFFPMNKFSTVPLLMKAARAAFFDSNGDDAKKTFMVLPKTHVIRLATQRTAVGTYRVTGVDTSAGSIPLAANGVAVIACGTIESTRLALVSFENAGLQTLQLMGKNLIAHLRSNLTIRVPQSSIPNLSALRGLQTSALFVKGRHNASHFHLQITASGGQVTVGAEDTLFKKIPDVDFFDALSTADDTTVAIAIRAIGEMEAADPANPGKHPSSVDLGAAPDEYGARRASVNIQPTQRDNDLWDAMDHAMDQLANLFANGAPFDVVFDGGVITTVKPGDDLAQVSPYVFKSPQQPHGRRDGLGTTHHETGTLWMGTDPAASVTDSDGRFHRTENLYAAGPCLFPTIGSPNPMLTGVALARRTGDRIVAPAPASADTGFQMLFDGTTLAGWQMSTIRNQPGRDNPGRFALKAGTLEAQPGTDLGLLWYTQPSPPNFILKVEWMMTGPDDNSGVFIRFPHPEQQKYDSTAWVAINFGFEIQIDERARPDGAAVHRTAAVYGFKGPDNPTMLQVRPIGEWNVYEIRVSGQQYQVQLNGQPVTTFAFAAGSDPQSPTRGLPSTHGAPRFIGLQTHTGRVLFRRIQWRPL